MIHHIVLLKPRAGNEGEMPALGKAIGQMLSDHFPRVTDYAFGPNLAPIDRQHGFSHGFSMRFENLDALVLYGDAPAHQPIKARVREACETTLAFDYSVEISTLRSES